MIAAMVALVLSAFPIPRLVALESLDVAVTGNGKVVVANRMQEVRSLDLSTGKLSDKKKFGEEKDWSYHVALSGNGKRFFTLESDKTKADFDPWNVLQVWSVESGKLLKTIASEESILVLAADREGKYVAAGCGKKVLVFDVEAGKSIGDFSSENVITTICVSLEAKVIACGDIKGFASVHVRESGEFRQVFRERITEKHQGSYGRGTAIDILEQSTVAFGKVTGGVVLVDVKTNKVVREIKGDTSVSSLAFSPDGKKLAIGLVIYSQLLNLETGEQIFETPVPKNEAWITAIGFSPSGTHLVTGNDEAEIHAWDAKTGRPLERD